MYIFLNKNNMLLNHIHRKSFLSTVFCSHNKYQSSKLNSRNINNSPVLREDNKQNPLNKEISKIKPFNKNEDHIWVGPPHPVSNLRLKVFPTKHLTMEEAHFYEKSKEIQEWSQQYWESHNKDFEDSKKSYMEKVSKERKSDKSDLPQLTSEEMADFYKEFLNKNYNKHVSFNWQWYKKNFELLYLSAKAKVSKLRKNGKK